MAGEKLVQKALQAAMEARAAKHVADPAERAANLAKWQAATPAHVTEPTWYHGTRRELSEFEKNHPTFLTTNPNFANRFAWSGDAEDLANDVLVSNKFKNEPPQPMVMPFHVRTENPFDYDNYEHLKKLNDAFMKASDDDHHISDVMRRVKEGSWKTIENQEVQNLLQDLGHDAFYVMENGNKNLAIYNPETQLKSATGNLGTFDPTSPRIDENRGGEIRQHHADGGPVYQSTGEKLVDDGKINWGDPNEARDFFRADQEDMRRKRAEEEAARAADIARRTAGLPDGVTAYAPIGGGMESGSPILAAIRGQESSGDVNAQSRTSSAGGLYGFIDKTWANTLRRMDPERFGRMSDEELAALKKGPLSAHLQQAAADYHLNTEIAPTLNKAGIPATPGNVYLGWFQGPQGAVKANTLPPDARVADVFPNTVGPNASIRFNGKPYAEWTMSDLRAWADATMAKRMGRDHGGEVNQALNVVRQHHADGEAVSDVDPKQIEAQRAIDLANRIRAYETSMREINAQPEEYRMMTHGPEKPMAPVQIEGGYIGKKDLYSAPYDVAGPMSKLAQFGYDMKTLPLYFTPAAPYAMASDIAEGVAAGSPTQVAMSALGPMGRAARVATGITTGATAALSPDEAQAAKVPKPKITRSTNLPNIREMSLDDAIKIARREPHLIPSGEISEGYYIGGPRAIENKRQLTNLRKNFDEYVGAEPRGGDWYDRYRASVNEVTGGDPVANEWMTKQHGQFSAGVAPDSELAFAIKENNAAIAGMPVKAARPAQHEAHMAAVAAKDPNELQLGEKTGEYARLISPDQARPAGATGVNDFRHARNFRYTEAGGDAQRDALTSAQHKFLDYETALAVDRANKTNLGGRSDWTGEKLQAAPWVRQKALDILGRRPNLIEQHMPEQLALAKAAGLEGDAAMAAARKQAESLGYESAFKEANKTIGDFFDKHTAFATHEAQPGSMTGHLPGSMNATEAERIAYATDPRSTWAFAPGDRDALYAGLGVPETGVNMRVRPSTEMQGAYMNPQGVLESNPGEVARPLVAFNAGDVKTVGNADRSILDAAEKVRAYLDAQNAGAWHKPWAGGKPGLSNSYFVPMERAASPEELASLREAFTTQGPVNVKGEMPRPLFSDIVDTGRGMTVTSFGDNVPAWDKAPRKEIERILSKETPADAQKAQRVAVDSGYAGLEGLWPQGGGAVTRDVLKDINKTPELRAAFNENPYIPQKALNNLERDKVWAQRWGATNQAIDNARKIIGEGPGWIDRLEAALKNGTVLPAIAATLLSPAALRQAGGTEE